jgi:hypothetical protein
MAEKPIRFCGHTQFEMKRRGISRGLATATIHAPRQVVPSNKGRATYQSLIEISKAGSEERSLLESLSNHIGAKGAVGRDVTPQKLYVDQG